MDVIYRYDPFAPIESPVVPDAAAAINLLTQGNDRFVGIVQQMQLSTLGVNVDTPIVIPFSPVSMGLPLFEGAMPKQAPFAAVLGCSDARVPTEAVFDQSFNQLFVLRIAGNVLGSECLGSLHFAVKNLKDSLKLIVVLGHSKCGAVTAAVDAHLSPSEFFDIGLTFPLRSLVDQIQISVRGAARALEKREGTAVKNHPDYRSLLVATAVYLNAAVSALELHRELHLLGSNVPQVVFGVYDLETLRVQSSPSESSQLRLRQAPVDAHQLTTYAAEIVETLMTIDDESRARKINLTMKW